MVFLEVLVESLFSYFLLIVLYFVCSYVLLKELDIGVVAFVPFYNLFLLYKKTRSSIFLFVVNVLSVFLVAYHYFVSLPMFVAYLGVVLSLLFILPVYNQFIFRYPKDYFLFYVASLFGLPILFFYVVSQNLVFVLAIFYVYLIYLRGDLFFGEKEPTYFLCFLLPFALLFFVLAWIFFGTLNVFSVLLSELLLLFWFVLLCLIVFRSLAFLFTNESGKDAFMNALTYAVLLGFPIFMNVSF